MYKEAIYNRLFYHVRLPADEFKCLEDGCLLGNRLPNQHDLRTHIKLHTYKKPEDQDSGFLTDQSGKIEILFPKKVGWGIKQSKNKKNLFVLVDA